MSAILAIVVLAGLVVSPFVIGTLAGLRAYRGWRREQRRRDEPKAAA